MTIPNLELHLVIRRAVTKRPDDLLDDAALLWARFEVELMPIIGEGGFHSLFIRSVNLTASTYAWMSVKELKQPDSVSFKDLMSLFKDREANEATEAIITLLIVFTDILATLIGLSLTTRILCSAWGDDAFDLSVPEQNNER